MVANRASAAPPPTMASARLAAQRKLGAPAGTGRAAVRVTTTCTFSATDACLSCRTVRSMLVAGREAPRMCWGVLLGRLRSGVCSCVSHGHKKA